MAVKQTKTILTCVTVIALLQESKTRGENIIITDNVFETYAIVVLCAVQGQVELKTYAMCQRGQL